MPPEGTSSPAPLRFDDAAPTESAQAPTCTQCSTSIGTAYYELASSVICPACKGRLEAELMGGSGSARFLKASGLGFGAALLGAAIYYAILALTGYEVGLVAILVGWLVGRAVHHGAGGRGGWAYQALAVGLTYFAIVSTYIPMIVKGLKEDPPAAAASTPAAQATVAAEPATTDGATPAASSSRSGPISLGGAALAVGALLLIAAAAPFLAGIQNVLGILIISFGLYQAWKMNRRTVLAFTGPYAIGAAGAGSAVATSD
jgi:hypothetical protein